MKILILTTHARAPQRQLCCPFLGHPHPSKSLTQTRRFSTDPVLESPAMRATRTEALGYWIALSRVPRLGSARFRLLESFFDGDMTAVWDAPARDLRAAGVGRAVAQSIVTARETSSPEQELSRLRDAGVAAINWHDPAYPYRLKETDDAPPVLYVRGALPPVDAPSIAVVGTRRPSDYGYRVTADLSSSLAAHGVVVVSGLALGIDARAHKSTVDAGGTTVAVLGNGLDTVYPRENLRLAERIVAEGGAIISEFPLGVRPEASHFPRRNRIISGMTLGTLVTEAGETSGTRWTVYHALEQNREIFCVPGSIYSESSRLTNRLIREGAKLVCNVNDILVEIGLETSERQIPLDLPQTGPASGAPVKTDANGSGESTRTQYHDPIECERAAPETPDDDEAELLQHITKEPVHIDDLVTLSRRPIAEISGLLTMLELKGLVRQVGTMHYQLVT